jgi:hypothetical protein
MAALVEGPEAVDPSDHRDLPWHQTLILQRMMGLHPKIIDLTLDRVHRLLAALGHPQTRCRR